jgi:two-component system LytT family response regulator
MEKIKCVIIDDEPLARRGLKEYLSEVDFLELAGEYENPLEASSAFNNHRTDLIFLDIQMPRINGIEFLKITKNTPMVIIVSAFSEYALDGYELDVIDYLLKPVTFERFLKSVNKAKEFFDLKLGGTITGLNQKDFFFTKSNGLYEKIYFKDILFVQALQNYVEIHMKNKKLITHSTLKAIYTILPNEKFIKVHKSFIISTENVDSFSNSRIKLGNVQIPISKFYKDEVVKRLYSKKL